MKRTAKNIAAYVHKQLAGSKSSNISISFGKLHPTIVDALRKYYGFSKVEYEGFCGYWKFEIEKEVRHEDN